MKAEIKRLIVDCKHGRSVVSFWGREFKSVPSLFLCTEPVILDIGKSLVVVITVSGVPARHPPPPRPVLPLDIYAANQQTLIKLCILDFGVSSIKDYVAFGVYRVDLQSL